MTLPHLISSLLAALAVALVYLHTPSSTMSASMFKETVRVETTVVSKEDVGSAAFYRRMAERSEPLVMKKSLASTWPAMRKWDLEYISAQLPTIPVYRQEGRRRTFITFHDNKPMEALLDADGSTWRAFNTKVNISTSTVFHGNNSSSASTFHYFSADIRLLREFWPSIDADVSPYKELLLAEEGVQINLWLGRQGIVTHTHYDANWNFFAQVKGRKRFTFFPPSAPVYLYPCVHPHQAHSQVDILAASSEVPSLKRQFPDFVGEATAFVAEVGPGDLLLVPPYWMHHVETIEDAISINFWTEAPDFHIMNTIYGLPIPFESDWSQRLLSGATREYLQLLVARLQPRVPRMDALVQRLLSQRYHPIFASGKLRRDKDEELRTKILCSEKEELEVAVRGKFEVAISRLVAHFEKLSSSAVLELNVLNYMEHLIAALNPIEAVYPFILYCLTQ